MKKSSKTATALVCYVHRKQYTEVQLNTEPYFPTAYDFCPTCETWMLRNFERDMLGLHLLPLDKPAIRVETRRVKS